MGQRSSKADSAHKVAEAIKTIRRLGYTLEQFFLAAKRYTGEPFNAVQAARTYEKSQSRTPPEAIVCFAEWVQATEPRRMAEQVKKFLGREDRTPSLEMEVVAGLAPA